MDRKKQQSKNIRQGSSRLTSAEQQAQLALAQQLGIPPEFLDPSLMGYGASSGIDPQQLLNPMATAAGGYPFMNPAALQAFTGLGAMSGQSSTGEAEWWGLAQNQALAASLGSGFYPGMIPGYPMLQSDNSQKSRSSSQNNLMKVKDDGRWNYDNNKMSPRPGSSGVSHSHQERKKSNESMNSSSKERPESHHSTSSPFAGLKQNNSNSRSSWMDGLSNQQQQKLNEQVLQAEIMRQLEQQFLVQQIQRQQQQQQQQDQLSAALQSVMTGSVGNLPGSSSSSSSHKKVSSDAEKMQQQMAMMMQQMMQAGASSSSMQGISPAMAASLFSTPGALETMMAMNQLGGMNPYANLENSKKQNLEERLNEHPSSSNRQSFSLHNSSKNLLSAAPGSSKTSSRLSSPNRKSHQLTQSSALSTAKNSTPPIPGIPGAELTADNALLAAIHSQQLQQYESLIKQELDAVNRLRDQNKKSILGESSKSVKQEAGHHFESKNDFFQSHNRNNLYSPANSTSSRGKSHTSPHREFSSSPFRKQHDAERSQSRGSASSKHLSPSLSKHITTKNHGTGIENMADTLKIFSALSSNPNLSQQDLAALLSLPSVTDPAALLAGMPPYQFPTNATNQMTSEQLEKLNKDLASALAIETQKLQEQLRNKHSNMDNNRKKGKEKDNHISVIHQNNAQTDESSDWQSSSKDTFGKVLGKRSLDSSRMEGVKLGNGDAASSDGDVNSEASAEKNSNYLPAGRNIRKRRRIITNEDEIIEPLKHDWKREVRFKFAGNQLRGEVIYIAPSGKKFRTYPDVIKHLEENKMTHLHRNNFSFSSRLRIGSFYEQSDKDQGNRQWVKMTEEELDQRMHQLDRGQTLSPFPDNSDQMSDYSSSSKGDGKSSKKEREQEKEQLKILRQQEKIQKQQRMEREIRERMALEELERQRMTEALEREQRRQQMLLMRALENRKRAEERERRREELRIEKIMQREKKMEQRRIAMQIARELKMPVEDMTAIGAPDLPDLARLQGTYDNKCPHQLSGNACADLLMVLEFVKTFKECLRIEDAIIPSFEQLQLGLLNDPVHTPVLVQITMSLLHQCLCDPGVPAPGPWLHCLTGVKVTDIDVGDDNYSEILRLFIWARSGYKTEIAVRLETIPFPSLTTDEKAQSLAFLVNELVCSRPICMEIEKNLDMLATLRRDKWIVEGQMRQLRVAHEKNPILDSPIIKLEDEDNSNSSMKKGFTKSGAVGGDLFKEEPQEENCGSLFQKKMEEMTQQHNSYNTQLARSSKPLRAVDIGQDRYKRRYWVLPNLGGVYVEGLESGISYEDDEESPDEDEDEQEEEKTQKHSIKKDDTKHLDKDAIIEKEEELVPKETENPYLDDQNGTMEIPSPIAQDSNNDSNIIITDQSNSSAVNDTAVRLDTALTNHTNDKEVTDTISSISKDYDTTNNLSSIDVSTNILDRRLTDSNASLLNTNATSDNSIQSCEQTEKLELSNGSVLFPVPTSVDTSAVNSHLCDDLENVVDTDVSDQLGDDTIASPSLSPVHTPETACIADPEICKSSIEKENTGRNDESENRAISPIFRNSTHPDHNSCSALVEAPASKQKTNFPALTKHLNENVVKGRVSSNNMGEDSVMAAAKAIAAKAVASSSHLLFPKNETPPKSKQKTLRSPTKQNDKKSNLEIDAGALPIGEHTINTLVRMGVNPASLTSQQLEVLSHLDMPINDEGLHSVSKSPSAVSSEKPSNENGEEARDKSTNEDMNNDDSLEESEKNSRKKSLDGQDIPMDLSRPPNSSENDFSATTNKENMDSSFSPAKDFPIKIEQSGDSPFRDESDSKSLDNKFFVPISTSNNVKSEPNQAMSSCPSPNTLANYIMSSVNYSQLPALDDIKFPIRAPDVKEEPDAIPRDKKRGWWRVESEAELRCLSQKLHLRGIREKQLHRSITKNFEICTNSMADSTLPEHQFVVLSNKTTGSESDKKMIADCNDKTSKTKTKEVISSRFVLAEKLAFEAEIRILHLVENLAVRCVDMNVVPVQWRIENPKPSMCRKDMTHVPLGPLRDDIGNEIKFDALNPIQHDSTSALGAAVDLLGCLERSVYRRYLKPPLVRKGGASEFSSLPSLSEAGAMDVAHGLRIWRNAVASSSSAAQLSLCIRQLDACIAWDRSTTLSPVKSEIPTSTKAKKKKTEKRAVPKTKIGAEGPNQPKKKRKKKLIPAKTVSSPSNTDGKQSKHSRMPIDTADVISKLVPAENGSDVPLVAVNGDVVDSNSQSQDSHDRDLNLAVGLKDLENSVTTVVQSTGTFSQANGQNFSENFSPNTAEYHTNSDNVSEEYKPSSEAKKKKKKKKNKKAKSELSDNEFVKKSSKPKKRADKDTINCRNILRELQSHEAATWFLFPVDCKLVPGYRKIIKKPIDFHTIESRLKRGRYKSKEDFVSEVRLVFDNCRKFNEDNSNIGRAGHQIRDFFESRWSDVLREKYGETIEKSLQLAPDLKPDTEMESNSVSESAVTPEYSHLEQDSSEGCLVMDES